MYHFYVSKGSLYPEKLYILAKLRFSLPEPCHLLPNIPERYLSTLNPHS